MAETKGELIVLHDRRDRLEANRVVRKLETAGFRVARQDPATPRRAKEAGPTVVLWSRHTAGRGLRSALSSDTAVIAKLDSRIAPSGAKVSDLRGWRGQDRHEGWKTLLKAVAPAAAKSLASTGAAPSKGPALQAAVTMSAEDPVTEKKSILPALVGVLAIAGVLAAAAYLFL